MNQKYAKNIRRAIRKKIKGDYESLFKEMCEFGLWARIKFGFMIIFKKPPIKRSKS